MSNILGIYLPIHIDECNLRAVKFTFNKWINDNKLNLRDFALVYNYQTFWFCKKYGLWREFEVITWLESLESRDKVNIWIQTENIDRSWELMYDYVTCGCGTALFIDGDNHPELDKYISNGYSKLVRLTTEDYIELHE